MDPQQLILELKNMIRPMIDEYFTLLEEKMETKFKDMVDNLKQESQQAHTTVAENQRLLLNFLHHQSNSSSTSPSSGSYDMQENGKEGQEQMGFIPKTSRQRVLATTKAAKEKAKKSLSAEVPKKRKTNNSVVATATTTWDLGGEAIIEESSVPLSTFSSDYTNGASISDGSLGGNVLVIRESTDQWPPIIPKPPKQPSTHHHAPPKKKAEVPVIFKSRRCDCCGTSLNGNVEYWYFFKKLKLLEAGTKVDYRQKDEGNDVQNALEVYVGKKEAENGENTLQQRKGRKLVRVGGSTCHQCHLRQPKWVTCPCGRRFCSKCLAKYDDTVENAHETVEWECPFCAGLCNCAACRRDKAAAGDYLPPNTRFTFELCTDCASDWSNSDTIVVDTSAVTMRLVMKFMEEATASRPSMISF